MTRDELSKLNDCDLMHRVLAGDEIAVEVFCRRKDGLLSGYLYKLLGDGYKRDEIKQETWIKLIKYFRKHPGAEIKNIDAFICRTAHNVAFPRKPKKPAPDFLPMDDEMPETIRDDTDDDLFVRENHKLFDKQIDMLPPRMKEIVLLRHQGYSFADIESILNLRKHTASSRYSKAVKMILKAFGREDDENIF